MKNTIILLAAISMLGACTAETTPPDNELSRDDARSLGGKSDFYDDVCLAFGWYDDGICDEFCPMPDLDCGGSCVNDADCPQPLCVFGGTCPTTVCDAGQCVTDNPADDCGAGERECGVCNGNTVCASHAISCPLVQCMNGAGEGELCGGIAGIVCETGLQCDMSESMCGADISGTCRGDVPQFCTEQFDPVCGCDGVTYDNDCFRSALGVGLASRAACGAGEGDFCGGIAGIVCETGLQCDMSESMCGADISGTCRSDVPQFCTEQFDPVCGCDGVTYDNDCFRSALGVALASRGACGAADGELCGGIAGIVCETGLQCDMSESMCGADISGTCRSDAPQFCTEQFDPVCGCDGVTYDNDCFRSALGVGLASWGECP